MYNPYEANIKRSGEATACYNGLCIMCAFVNMFMESPEHKPAAEKALKEMVL